MDAAVAGLIGAGIGGSTGLVGAMAAPIFTARANHRRERREVYVRALAAIRRVQHGMYFMLTSDVAESEEVTADVDMFRSGAEIALVGAPAAVRDAFDRTRDLILDWPTGLDGQVPVPEMDESDQATLRQRLVAVGVAIQELEEAMRDDVG